MEGMYYASVETKIGTGDPRFSYSFGLPRHFPKDNDYVRFIKTAHQRSLGNNEVTYCWNLEKSFANARFPYLILAVLHGR